MRVLSGGETVLGMRVAYTPGPRLPPRLLPTRGEWDGVCRRRRRLPDPAVQLGAAADAAARHRHRDLGRVARPCRWLGAGAPGADALRGGRGRRPRLHRGRAGRGCARRPSWRARWMPRSTRPIFSAGCESQMAAEGHGEETVAELLQAVPTAYQWRGLDRYWRKRAEREAAPELSASGEVLADPLDGLFDALVRGGQGDAEEALAARARTSSRARSRPWPPPAPARRKRSRCGPREREPRCRSCPSAR